MIIEKLNIESCFNIISSPRVYERFSPTDGPVYDPHLFEQMIYRCQDCKFEIAFNDKDFKKHSNVKFTNLSKGDSDNLDNFVMNNSLKVRSYLDFYCPTCNTATRLFFSDGHGGKCGEYLVNIDFGLTIKK